MMCETFFCHLHKTYVNGSKGIFVLLNLHYTDELCLDTMTIACSLKIKTNTLSPTYQVKSFCAEKPIIIFKALTL